MTKKIKAKLFYRDMELDRASVNDETRTADLSFSSELPVRRYFGEEILDHSPRSIDLSRLNNGGALLVNHDPDKHVGVVESASVKSKRGQATVRFGKSDEAEKVFTDVKDGIRRGVSIGYRVHKMVLESEADGMESYRVTSWEPYEISVVSVPADPTVGVGRGNETEYEIEVERTTMEPEKKTDPTPQPTPQVDVEAQREQIRVQERAEVQKRFATLDKAIEVATNPKVAELAREWKSNDKPMAEFHRAAFEAMNGDNVSRVEEPHEPLLGMSDKEVKRYSILRAIRSLSTQGGTLDGLELECSRAVAKSIGKEPGGFFIPMDVQAETRDYREGASRALEVGTFTGAGSLVGVTSGGQTMIELLRNNMVAVQAGATTLSGLVGDVNIPTHTGTATAYWLAEGATLSATDSTTGQLALRPHRLAAATAFSKQLIAQSSVDVENFVRTDILASLAIAKDLAAFRGTGVSGEPLGIINTSGLSTTATHTSGGTFTWGQALDYEAEVEANNALGARMAYVMRPADKQVAKATVRDSGGGGFVWDNGMINGYPAFSTNQLTSGSGGTLFGNFSDLIIADWDGWDVVVDPYTLATKGQIQIVIQTLTDIGLRHPESFSLSGA